MAGARTAGSRRGGSQVEWILNGKTPRLQPGFGKKIIKKMKRMIAANAKAVHAVEMGMEFGGPTGRTGTSYARAPIARASWHLDVDSVHPGV